MESAQSSSRTGCFRSPETNQVVKWRGVVKQRFGEFWIEIPGTEANLDGWFRTPVRVSRIGECRAGRRIVANPCGKGVK